MRRGRFLTLVLALPALAASLLVGAPAATAAPAGPALAPVAAAPAASGCYSMDTAPTPGPGQVVLWKPYLDGNTAERNTVVIGIGDPQLTCFLDYAMPTVVAVAPGAALFVWGDDGDTRQTDLYIPWGGLSISQSTPININPETPENWVGTTAFVTVISAKDMLEKYGSCQYCDLTGQTLKLPGYLQQPKLAGVLEGVVAHAKFANTTLTGDGSRYDFTEPTSPARPCRPTSKRRP